MSIKSSLSSEFPSDCAVCVETMNKGSRRPIKCKHCNFVSCSECFCKYLLDTVGEPLCMSCKVHFDQEFVMVNTSKSFYDKKYRVHRAEVQYSLERSLLPETQLIAEQRKSAENYVVIMKELRDREKALRKELDDICTEKIRTQNIINRLISSTTIIDVTQTDRRYGDVGDGGEGSSSGVSKERQSFHFPCVVSECRGFLSSSWKCGLCNTWACPDCHEAKKERNDPTHVCDENTKASVAFMAKDVKPCPKCTVPIHRISGCPQMYCTQCHTAFDWNTGKIQVGGIIHNPHYYDWVRANNGGVAPRNHGDIPCGGIPAYYDLLYSRQSNVLIKHFSDWYQCHRLITHIDNVELPNYEVRGVEDNIELRISYLLGKITEDQFKSRIKTNQKKREKKADIYQIFDMFKVTISETFQMILNSEIECADAKIRAHSLRKYVNEQFLKIRDRYSCVVPSINEKWEIKSVGGSGVSSSNFSYDLEGIE